MTLEKILFTILNTLIIFTPIFRILPKWTWIVAVFGIACLFDKYTARKLGFYSKQFLLSVSLLMVSFIFAVISPIIHKTYDFTYLPFLIGLALCIFRGILLVYIFNKIFDEEANIKLYMKYFIYSCLIYVGFTVAFIILPSFKEFWFNYVIIPIPGPDYFAYKFRYSLDGFAAFSAAGIFSIALLINAYLLISANDKNNIIKNLASYMVILCGCFIYGRVTIFAIIASIIFIIISCEDKKKLKKLFLYLTVICTVMVIFLLQLGKYNNDIMVWTNWAFELIVNLFKGKLSNTYSLTHMLEDMYFIPSLKTIMLGDGRYLDVDRIGYYMQTDVGFLRPVLFFGIFGLITNYSAVIVILNKLRVMFNKQKDKAGAVLIICIFIIWMILEMKGETFHRVLYCMLPMYFIQYKREGLK